MINETKYHVDVDSERGEAKHMGERAMECDAPICDIRQTCKLLLFKSQTIKTPSNISVRKFAEHRCCRDSANAKGNTLSYRRRPPHSASPLPLQSKVLPGNLPPMWLLADETKA